MKIIKSIYKFIKTVIFVVLALYIAFILVQRFGDRDIKGFRIYTVSSNSMVPTFEKGDVILVRKSRFDELKKGDIITYKGETGGLKGLTITHRIVEINYNRDGKVSITTRGDNNDADDPSIEFDQVVGVVTYRFITFSYMSKWINNKFIFFFFVFVPLTIVLFLEGADFFGSFKDDDDDDDEDGEEDLEDEDEIDIPDEDEEDEDEDD